MIHPGQIAAVNREFGPSESSIEDALAVVAQFRKHTSKGVGAFEYKGKVVDLPGSAPCRGTP